MKYQRRFIVLIAALLLLVVGLGVFLMARGDCFTDVLIQVENQWAKQEDLNVTIDHPDVIELRSFRLNEKGNPCLELRSVKEGTATATIRFSGMGKTDIGYRVDRFGTITNVDTLNFNGYLLFEIGIIAGMLLVFLTTLSYFIESYKKARFSYFMISCGGIGLFCLSLITVVVYKMQWMNTFRSFLTDLLNTGYLFSFVSAPFVLAIAGAVSVSNIWLLKREGFRPQNMLGIALGVVWILALVAINFGLDLIFSSNYEVLRRVRVCCGYILSFFTCMLLSTILCAYLASKRKADYPRDYLAILGCCIRKDGTLTPILKGRADAAIRFEREQFASTGKHAKFVTSGGQGADEVISESEAMKRYLMEQGYEEDRIIKEDKSVNTDQNILFSRNKIQEDASGKEDAKVGVATTSYHIFRSYVLSRKHKLDAQGISAKTKWYFFPNAFLREFVGLLNDRKFTVILIIVSVCVLYNLGEYWINLA